MNRLKFYTKTTIDGIEELDFLHNSLSGEVLRYTPTYYRVKSIDTYRPDMISYKCYGTVEYWWLILLVNGIDDGFTELQPGMVLTIPNILDIFNFNKKYALRRQ